MGICNSKHGPWVWNGSRMLTRVKRVQRQGAGRVGSRMFAEHANGGRYEIAYVDRGHYYVTGPHITGEILCSGFVDALNMLESL